MNLSASLRRLALRAALLAVMAVTAIAVTGVANAPGAHAAALPYGAFAYSPARHSIVDTGYGVSARDAQTNAVARCARNATDCLPVTWFTHAYAAFATGAGTGGDQAWAWGRSGLSARDAEGLAISFCQQHGGGSACRIVLPAQTAAPDPSAQTGQDLVGRVCFVNAPSGADLGLGPWGHVGWMYLADRDYGTWNVGANEGPDGIYGSPSKTWRGGGSWDVVVNLLKSAGNFHSADYYKYIRCQSVDSNNWPQAASTAATQHRAAYYVPNSDCLSNAVDVIRSYGVTDTPFWLPEHRPNVYFSDQLDRASYGPVLPLR
jgi:hypothetical protein